MYKCTLVAIGHIKMTMTILGISADDRNNQSNNLFNCQISFLKM